MTRFERMARTVQVSLLIRQRLADVLEDHVTETAFYVACGIIVAEGMVERGKMHKQNPLEGLQLMVNLMETRVRLILAEENL